MNHTEHTRDTMDDELRAIEDQLEQLSPTAMPDDMLARMEAAMDRWHESVPVEEKIVAFEPIQQEKGRLRLFNTWASAAAVAAAATSSKFERKFDGGEIHGTTRKVISKGAPRHGRQRREGRNAGEGAGSIEPR